MRVSQSPVKPLETPIRQTSSILILALIRGPLSWRPTRSSVRLCYNLRIPDSDEQMFNNTLDNFIMSIDLAREQLNIQFQPSSTPQSIAQLA